MRLSCALPVAGHDVLGPETGAGSSRSAKALPAWTQTMPSLWVDNQVSATKRPAGAAAAAGLSSCDASSRIGALPRLDWTIKEAMRLFPPVPYAARQSLRECTLAGFEIPADLAIAPAALVTHRLPEFWSDPDRFDPDRDDVKAGVIAYKIAAHAADILAARDLLTRPHGQLRQVGVAGPDARIVLNHDGQPVGSLQARRDHGPPGDRRHRLPVGRLHVDAAVELPLPGNRVAPPPEGPTATSEAGDRMRQLLHELRTPAGAIQGFAELIQQQMFGSAPNEYRALAAAVSVAGPAAAPAAGGAPASRPSTASREGSRVVELLRTPVIVFTISSARVFFTM